MKRLITVLVAVVAAFGVAIAGAQDKKTRISIGTGGTGGVYYPLGGGLAALISKYVPGVEATAEVTAGSIANLQLIDSGKSEIGFTMADAAWDAANGLDKFNGKRVPLRTIAVFYPNRMHVVTIEGTGINSMKDLKGKRVSTGAGERRK
jgi:TRAP transporter TAXI family solute receptor